MEFVYYDDFSREAREHGERPRNYGQLRPHDGHAKITGPCGDTMEFWVAERGGKIIKVNFTTDGCGPSRACGSVATCLAQGKDFESVMNLRQSDVLEALREFPARFEHCALLAVNTLKGACEDYLSRQCGQSDAGPQRYNQPAKGE